MFACFSGHKDVVQLLLNISEKDINLNARTYRGQTAFMIACVYQRKNVVKLLVEHSKTKGIDISIGQTELHDEMKIFIDSLQ